MIGLECFMDAKGIKTEVIMPFAEYERLLEEVFR